jgi:hypothetical protein
MRHAEARSRRPSIEALRQRNTLSATNVDVKPFCAAEALCWKRVLE